MPKQYAKSRDFQNGNVNDESSGLVELLSQQQWLNKIDRLHETLTESFIIVAS